MHDQAKQPSIADTGVPTLGIDEVIAFLRRQGALILAAAMLAASVAGIVVLLRPQVYESSATLVVFPPRVSSELQPATLTVLGLQQILESDAVIHATKKRLVADGVLEASDRLALPLDVASRIFVSRRSEDKALAPMIQTYGRGASPQAAAAIANAWTLEFLAAMRALVTGSTAATVSFVDSQYAEQHDALTREEDALVALRAKRRQEEDALSIDWLRRISRYQAEASDDLAAYRAETSRVVQSYRGEKTLDTRQGQLDAMRTALVALQEEQSSVTAALAKSQLTLESLRHEAGAIPASRSFHKAITDDALWSRLVAEDGTVDWSQVEGLSLTSEERNPIYDDLMQRITWVTAEEASLRPRAGQLSTQIRQLAATMAKTEAGLRADLAGLAGLEETRSAGLDRLDVEQVTEIGVLERQRDQALTLHREQTDNLTAQRTRAIEQRRALFDELAKNYNEAVIAKAQTDLEEVRLAAKAVAPDGPQPRRLWLKISLAGIVGALLGLLAGLVNDRRRLGLEV